MTTSLLEVGFEKVVATIEERPDSEEPKEGAVEEEGDGNSNSNCCQCAVQLKFLAPGHGRPLCVGRSGERHSREQQCEGSVLSEIYQSESLYL